jgi:uncharacterized repeat protein (TIGR03803 family)
MTYSGGANLGNIFSIGTDGTNYRNLLSFSGGNGNPGGSLTLSGSTFYGMTESSAYGDGSVFSIGTDGTNYRSLFSFSGSNGKLPVGDLTLVDSTLYGMTYWGGSYGQGCIFSIGTDGTNFQDLVSFDGSNYRRAYGDLTLSGSTLFGMTRWGGSYGDGTVFAFTLPTPEPSTFVLLGVGAATLLGYRWRRRLAKRSAQPESNDDTPSILAFPSESSHRVGVKRRAA